MFTVIEIELLQESLDAWVGAVALKGTVGMMLGAMMTPLDGHDAFKVSEEARVQVQEQETRLRKDRVLLLQAKLVGLKDSAIAESVSGLDIPWQRE